MGTMWRKITIVVVIVIVMCNKLLEILFYNVPFCDLKVQILRHIQY